MLESLKEDIQSLKTDIADLEKEKTARESAKATKLARMQAQIFLERIFAPYMDGICKVWGVTPEEGLQILIKEGATFDKIAQDNPAALAELKNQPAIKAILTIADPLKDVSEEWMADKMDILFNVMVDIRPELARCITETPGGKEWFNDSMTGLRDILFDKPQLNI